MTTPENGVLVHWSGRHGEWAWRRYTNGTEVNAGLLTSQEPPPDDDEAFEETLTAIARTKLCLSKKETVVCTTEDLDP